MPSRGDIQQQLSQIASIAKAQGLKLEDVMPEEMQEHFNSPAALKEARKYIKEADNREERLQDNIGKLTASLKAKQAEIDDLHEAIKASQVDHQQRQHSVDYYKKLWDNAQIQIERYRSRLAEANKRQTAADTAARRIKQLECDKEDRTIAVFKLVTENRAIVELHEAQREQDQKLLEEKDAKIISVINYANAVELERHEAVQNIEQTAETYDSLIERMEYESQVTVNTLHRKSVKFNKHVESNDQLYSALVSQITPMNRFYGHAVEILSAYQRIFSTFSVPKSNAIASIPQSLHDMLDAANDALEQFQHMSAALHAEGLAQEKVIDQIKGMAHNAWLLYNSLKAAFGLLERLCPDADAYLAIKNCTESGTNTVSIQTESIVPMRRTSWILDIMKRFT
ncbi:hypothetical protein GQ44DRAFT_724666 [Phaeosphaeriaceae sp. PMI808]|nr:hypothetical protein GQ44DRAFT_724666 [Phaeosphaeriaceae sp. PMI808]